MFKLGVYRLCLFSYRDLHEDWNRDDYVELKSVSRNLLKLKICVSNIILRPGRSLPRGSCVLDRLHSLHISRIQLVIFDLPKIHRTLPQIQRSIDIQIIIFFDEVESLPD